MPVLVLALSCFVAFVVILGMLAVAHAKETREARRTLAFSGGQPFTVLSMLDAFDPAAAVLWETQVPALELIHAAGARGVPQDRLHRLFFASLSAYPELYEGCGFDSWLGFLEQAQLVTRTPSRAFLTPEGEAFLRYRIVPATRVAA